MTTVHVSQEVDDESDRAIDRQQLRQILGNYPTGVAVVTTLDASGGPVGMTVGSFTSVSLDPPLVAFLPDRRSSTLGVVQEAGRFCVNVLSAGQEKVCRSFAMRGMPRFEVHAWTPSAAGLPLIAGALAWIVCELDAVHEAGDHAIVIGQVRDIGLASDGLPLLFFRGGYGQFTPLSMVAPVESDLFSQIRNADLARGPLERLAARLGMQCMAEALVDGNIVELASAGTTRESPTGSRVGLRLPAAPPMGATFMAWADDRAVASWLARSSSNHHPAYRQAHENTLAAVRERGWSVTLVDDRYHEVEATVEAMAAGGPTPELHTRVKDLMSGVALDYSPALLDGPDPVHVRSVVAPVFGPDHKVVLSLTVLLPTGQTSAADARHSVAALTETAREVSNALLA